MKSNIIKVKVYPKKLKAIPDILPFNKLIQGEPVELELTKKEILRCMNFADVFVISSGKEVLIDEISFKEIKEDASGPTFEGPTMEEEPEVDFGSEPIESSVNEPDEQEQE